MKYLFCIILLLGCATAPDYQFQNTQEAYGYIANSLNEPVLFHDVEIDSSFFVYGYTFEPRTARVNRKIMYRMESGKAYFIAELGFE